MPTIRILPDDRTVEVSGDETILQTSLRVGIPHTHECGGHARCTTCRVLVLQGHSLLTPPNGEEQAVTRRMGVPPEVRLACQTRVAGDVAVRRLVLDPQDIALIGPAQAAGSLAPAGEERVVTVLFADIRNFTRFAEASFPCDVVHVLNRYFARMGEAIGRHGGSINV